MSFPRYAKYKDSGVEWLGEVPEHWSTMPLKAVATVDNSGCYGEEPNDESDDSIPVATTAQISANGRFDVARMPRRTFTVDQRARYGCEVDDVLVVKSSGSATNIISGKAGLIESATPFFVFSNFLMRLSPKRRHVRGKFLYLLLLSHLTRERVKRMVSTTTYPNLQVGEYIGAILPIPGIAEQDAILSFLDEETAKIDELIEEQRLLIELLKEKRQAVISHAVTKGLNPTAPMRDSGVMWLGFVPAHWRVGRCGLHVKILSGFAFPSDSFSHNDADVRLLRGINVGVGATRWDDLVYWRRTTLDGLDPFELSAGDLVIGMDRPVIGSGVRVAKLTGEDVPSLLLQRVAKISTGADLGSEFLLTLLSSPFFIAHFSPETTGVSVPHISPEQISNFEIPIPPPREQSAIMERIAAVTTECDHLVSEADCAIKLLQERRSALISAAVTGKIDVRNYKPQPSAVAEEMYEPA